MEAAHSSEALITAFQATQQLSLGHTIDGFHCLEDLFRRFFLFHLHDCSSPLAPMRCRPGIEFLFGGRMAQCKRTAGRRSLRELVISEFLNSPQKTHTWHYY